MPEETIVSRDTDVSAKPGSIFKRCREYHGITLEDAEEATKIGINHLQTLESDQIEQFASIAYLKGFVRIYATYLGLNPDDMIRLYDKPASPDDAGKKKSSRNSNVPLRRKIPLKKLILPAFLLLCLIITSNIISRSPAKKLYQLPPLKIQALQPALSSVKQAAPPMADVDRNEPANQEKPANANPAENLKVPATAKSFIVKMKVLQNNVLTVTIDSSASQSYELNTGDSIEWRANDHLILELSNAGGVEAELNGKPLKAFGPTGRPVVVTLDAEGIR